MSTAGRRFERAAAVNVLGNAAKIAVEAVVGVLFGSVALLADAAHSVADFIASVVVYRWGGAGYTEADADHPHGHARFEPVTALVVGGAIGLMGLVLLSESTRSIFSGPEVRFGYPMLGAIAFAMGAMWVVYWYTVKVNTDLESTALRALAIDTRNDVLTSVAALVGVVGVWADLPLLDPLAGAVVSVLVIHQGIQVARENLSYLLGSAPPPAERERVREHLRTHPQVRGVHDLVIYYEGTALEVEAHVEVDGNMSLREAHALESELIEQLRDIDGIGDAHVHLDPSGVGEWKDADEAGSRAGRS